MATNHEVKWWVVEWEQSGRLRVKVFPCLDDVEDLVEWMWKKGIDPEYWMM